MSRSFVSRVKWHGSGLLAFGVIQPDENRLAKRTSGRSIRSHEKSRHGCLTCKKRRIKCDEHRPQCLRCQTDQRHCEYKVTQLHYFTQQSGDSNQELVRLPVPATLLPVHLTVTKEALDFRFFLQYSVPLLCSMSADTIGSRAVTSLFADDAVSSALGLRTNVYDKLWKELMPSIIYSNPAVHKLVCYFASFHRAAVDNTFQHNNVTDLEGYARVLTTVRRALQNVSPEVLIAISITLFAIDTMRMTIRLQPNERMMHLRASIAMIARCADSYVVTNYYDPVHKHFQSIFVSLLGGLPSENADQIRRQGAAPLKLGLPPAFNSCQEAVQHFAAIVCHQDRSVSAEQPSARSTAVSPVEMFSTLSKWRELTQSFYMSIKDTNLEDVNDVLTLLYEVNLITAAAKLSKLSIKP